MTSEAAMPLIALESLTTWSQAGYGHGFWSSVTRLAAMPLMIVVVVAGVGCDLCCCDVGVCVCVCVCVSGNAVDGRRRRCR